MSNLIQLASNCIASNCIAPNRYKNGMDISIREPNRLHFRDAQGEEANVSEKSPPIKKSRLPSRSKPKAKSVKAPPLPPPKDHIPWIGRSFFDSASGLKGEELITLMEATQNSLKDCKKSFGK